MTDLINIWKGDQTTSNPTDINQLIQQVEKDLKKVNRTIVMRDWREIIVGIIMIPLFAFIAIMIPLPLTKLGSVIIIGAIVSIIVKLRKARKPKTQGELSQIEFLQSELKYQKAQQHLLNTAYAWYVMPFYFGVVVFLLGFDMMPPAMMIRNLGIATGAAGAISWVNRYAARKYFNPKIEKLEQVISDLKNDK